MAFPFGFQELSVDDLKTFRRRYEDSVAAQPIDDLGHWYLQTYETVESGDFSEALSRLEVVLDESTDYSAFAAAKHLLAQVNPGSAVSYQLARRLLAHRSPLLFRYGLCLVTAGEVWVDREVTDAVARLACADEETMRLAQVAKLAIQTGVARHV